MAVLLLNEEHVNDYNKHNDEHEGHLVDTDGLVLVGEVAGEQVQGGSGGVNLHCALETILVRMHMDKSTYCQNPYFKMYTV